MGHIDNNSRIELRRIIDLVAEHNLEVNTFMEIGSKDGADAAYVSNILSIDPKNIYILEAHAAFYKMIKRNYPDYQVFNLAGWDETTQIEFHAARDRDDGRSSALPRDIYKDSNFIKTMVEATRIDHFLDQRNRTEIDVVKIDVEGATYEVLSGFGNILGGVKLFQLETELYPVWSGQKTKKEVFEFMDEAGFHLAWETDIAKTQNDSIWINKHTTQ